MYGKARVHDYAQVSGDAQVYGNAQMYDNARIFGSAQVYGNAQIYGNACVYGNAQVYGNARVYGKAWVSDSAWVSSDAEVYGSAEVSGNAWISSDAHWCVMTGFGSGFRSTTIFREKDGTLRVQCGYWGGTLEEFEKRVNDVHGDNRYGREYRAMIEMIKIRFEGRTEPVNDEEEVIE